MSDTGPIPFYLDVLSKWPSAIAPESQWFVYIPLKDVYVLKNNIFEVIKRYETGSGSGGTSWDTNQQIVTNLIRDEYQNGSTYSGCVFASRINLPQESIRASNQGLQYAGFQAPATMDYRASQTSLSIQFIETNSSFVDFVLRPWTIMVGHYGFVTRSGNDNQNIRVPFIDAVFLGKNGAFKSGPMKRKIIRFHNAAPIRVQGFSNSYGSEGVQSATVDFIYDYYSIEGTDAHNAIYQETSNYSNPNPKSIINNKSDLIMGFENTTTEYLGSNKNFGNPVNLSKFSVSGGGLTSTVISKNGAQLPTYHTPTPVQPFKLSPLPGQNTGQGPVRR